jgi:DNA topoisomerase I
MSNKLVIVESPAKAKTIGKYLGRGYTVRASVGHVRDLPKSTLGVDVARDFAPKYVVPRDKSETVKELKERVKAARAIYLATDPDREGEAIAWHLVEATNVGDKPVHRIVFHEITRDAILAAFKHPRPIDMRLVEAQQARRVLDRLVGYQISPLLWRKVRRGLSAGRVQSVALRLVVEREREIAAFVPREYWRLLARLQPPRLEGRTRREVEAELVRVRGEKADLPDGETVRGIVAALEGATYTVAEVRRRETQRRPAAPFTTSTLQQEAGRKLGMPVRRTMSLAQELYEGIDLGGQSEGLITYMRTDSVNVAGVAQEAARALIAERYGPASVPATPNTYRTRAKAAQEAHEAIRPTDPRRDPESVKAHLSAPQYRLYRLIWQRFIASQMAPALLDGTTVEVAARPPGAAGEAPYLFRATGSVITFPGFLAVYREGVDEGDDGLDEKALPVLHEGETLALTALTPSQHFTQPPARYTEASLVKALEEAGIGRPSTYAPTIATLMERDYVAREEKRLAPTELGELINDLLVEHFPTIVDTGFTSKMEEDLDDIATGERDLTPVLSAFYTPFALAVEEADRKMPAMKVADEPAGEACEKCGREMVIKVGRFGKFMACPGYPECKNTRPILTRIGVTCPKCGEGELVEKRARKGRQRLFYGCERYPECDFTSWQKPVPTPCPSCGGVLVEAGRDGLRCLSCTYTGSRPAALEPAGVAD